MNPPTNNLRRVTRCFRKTEISYFIPRVRPNALERLKLHTTSWSEIICFDKVSVSYLIRKCDTML